MVNWSISCHVQCVSVKKSERLSRDTAFPTKFDQNLRRALCGKTRIQSVFGRTAETLILLKIFQGLLNPFMPSGFFYLKYLDRSISNKRGVCLAFIITKFYRNACTYSNSVYPDQTPFSAASDLGLHCLSMFLFWNARLKWVKNNSVLATSLHYLLFADVGKLLYRCIRWCWMCIRGSNSGKLLHPFWKGIYYTWNEFAPRMSKFPLWCQSRPLLKKGVG